MAWPCSCSPAGPWRHTLSPSSPGPRPLARCRSYQSCTPPPSSDLAQCWGHWRSSWSPSCTVSALGPPSVSSVSGESGLSLSWVEFYLCPSLSLYWVEFYLSLSWVEFLSHSQSQSLLGRVLSLSQSLLGRVLSLSQSQSVLGSFSISVSLR